MPNGRRLRMLSEAVILLLSMVMLCGAAAPALRVVSGSWAVSGSPVVPGSQAVPGSQVVLGSQEVPGSRVILGWQPVSGLRALLAWWDVPGPRSVSSWPARPAAAWADAPGDVPFRWPLDGVPVVVSTFAPPPEPWLPGRRGVLLAANPDDPVYASGAGVVTFAGRVAGTGVVTVTHGGGLRTTYEPVDASVRVGDQVVAGSLIGRIGGRWPECPAKFAACLHWGLRRGEVYLDPLALLGLSRVRLLPP